MTNDTEEPGPSPAAAVKQPAQKPTLLLVNTGSAKKRFILQRLAKLNLYLVVLNAEKNWAEPYADDWIIANTGNHAESLRAVKDYVRQHPQRKPDGVLTFWEDDVLLTSKLVDEFKTIGIPFEVARKVRNKFQFRQFCAQNGLPHPKHAFLNSHELKESIKGLRFPLVVKPTYGSSSAYVVKVDDLAELDDVVTYLRKNVSTQTESALGDGLGIFCEEYIDGDEVDIDIVIQNGKIKFWSMSDNYQTNEPFFVETGQQIPSILPEQDQQDLVDMAEVTLEKLGVINGVIHFEAKMTKKGPVPIEVNLRMGGDEVHSFVKSAWHVDLADQAVKVALGRYVPKIEKPEEPHSCLAGKYFLPEESGILVNLDLPEKKINPSLGELHFFKQVGDPIFAPPEGYDFLGWVTAKGENANDARDNLDEIYESVEFEIVPFEPGSSVRRGYAAQTAISRPSPLGQAAPHAAEETAAAAYRYRQ
jgi:biotin carboxylase